MRDFLTSIFRFAISLVLCAALIRVCSAGDSKPRFISGVYPDLCTYSYRTDVPAVNPNECGIGAVVPWAGRLWMINYGAHYINGSTHSLYSVDEKLTLTLHPESIGGTPAARMIHRESNQLLIGPYLIDANGKVRVIPPSAMPGRLTAIARHLNDPANKVYYYDMEGMLYEVNVHTLEVKKLFEKPVPGWHGKGAYTSQGRLVVANNGEAHAAKVGYSQLQVKDQDPKGVGVLAQWDGGIWSIVERRQFTDVTGPGGIYGAPDDQAPLWAIGWDNRSLRLKLLDGGQWYTFLLPKAAHNNDARHGWYTEWPRIREIGGGKMLMDMHGMFFDFPKTFSAVNTAGIAPVGSHLRYIPDFCDWNGRLVLATDETSVQGNKLAGQPQCNLWFGTYEDLKTWGPASGFGGPWINNAVKAGVPSEPFLVNGFDRRVLHLNVQSENPVEVTIEVDSNGTGIWKEYTSLQIKGYLYHVFPEGFKGQWLRMKTDRDCVMTAYLHQTDGSFTGPESYPELFKGLAKADPEAKSSSALLFPSGKNRNLAVIAGGDAYEFTKIGFEFNSVAVDKELASLLKVKPEFSVDEASVIVMCKNRKLRLPRGAAVFDSAFDAGWPRAIREVESERLLANIHGTFYELPREDDGFLRMRPVATHDRRIADFCTWNGLLVLSGVESEAVPGEHIYKSEDGRIALWFGGIDDIWKFGKPVGQGGPWKNTTVEAGQLSDPYLMTGYDRKKVAITSDKDVTITLEVDFDHQTGWHLYKSFQVKAGVPVEYTFETGFSAHWIRAVSSAGCKATVWFVYE